MPTNQPRVNPSSAIRKDPDEFSRELPVIVDGYRHVEGRLNELGMGGGVRLRAGFVTKLHLDESDSDREKVHPM